MATSHELDELTDLLSGPVGSTLAHVGAVMGRKLADRDQTLDELSDEELADLLYAAAIETAETLHPGPEGQDLCRRLSDIFAGYGLEMRATAPTSAAMQ